MAQYFFKIINREKTHHGLEYKEGLITDIQPFNDDPEASCVPGGIYFTTAKHIWKYVYYGCNLALVTIPDDAQIVMDKSGDKWRADRIFIEGIYSIKDNPLGNYPIRDNHPNWVLPQKVKHIFFQQLELEDELRLNPIVFATGLLGVENTRPLLNKIKTVSGYDLLTIAKLYDKKTAFPFIDKLDNIYMSQVYKLIELFDKETIEPQLQKLEHMDNYDLQGIAKLFGKETARTLFPKWKIRNVIIDEIDFIAYLFDEKTAKPFLDEWWCSRDLIYPRDLEMIGNIFEKKIIQPFLDEWKEKALKYTNFQLSLNCVKIIEKIYDRQTAKLFLKNMPFVNVFSIFYIVNTFDKETAFPFLQKINGKISSEKISSLAKIFGQETIVNMAKEKNW